MIYKAKSQKIAEKIVKFDKGKKVVFVSQASINMCWARMLCKYVLDQKHVPVNYFTVFANFVHEIADLETMIDSINSLIVRCDELWAFGEISEGMWYEIKMCLELGIPVKFFSISKLPDEIVEIEASEVNYTPKFTKVLNENSKKFKPIIKILDNLNV